MHGLSPRSDSFHGPRATYSENPRPCEVRTVSESSDFSLFLSRWLGSGLGMTMAWRPVALCTFTAILALFPAVQAAQGQSEFVVLNDDGGWGCFQDERAIVIR